MSKVKPRRVDHLLSISSSYVKRILRYTAKILNSGYKVSVIVLAVLASIFTIVSGILTMHNTDEFGTWFDKTFKTKQYWISAVETLAPEVNVSYFDGKLGAATFTSRFNGLENWTYINDYFYTQALVSDDVVRLYSVTIRKPDFHPSIPYIRQNNKDPYKLGSFKYSDLRDEYIQPLALEYLPGLRRSIYSEMYYHGNPGNYLYYFFTINDAGYGGGLDLGDVKAVTFEETGLFKGCDDDIPLLGEWQAGKTALAEILDKAHEKTKDMIPNTYTVTDRGGSVFCEYKDFFIQSGNIILGPNLDKVRLLPFAYQ